MTGSEIGNVCDARLAKINIFNRICHRNIGRNIECPCGSRHFCGINDVKLRVGIAIGLRRIHAVDGKHSVVSDSEAVLECHIHANLVLLTGFICITRFISYSGTFISIVVCLIDVDVPVFKELSVFDSQ